jgi:hypothetical protein
MSQYSSILRGLSADKFSELLSASPRQAKENFFHRHGIKAPKTSGLPKAGAKNEARLQALFNTFQNIDDEEMAEDILRRWLLNKRPMLAMALDHLKIPHDNGLTDSNAVDTLATLPEKDIQALMDVLCASFPKDDVVIYLHFMGISKV